MQWNPKSIFLVLGDSRRPIIRFEKKRHDAEIVAGGTLAMVSFSTCE